MNVDFPFHVDGRNRTASTTTVDHVCDLIQQLVFTSPGERVNRPTFGAGLQQLVFAPNSPEVASALQFLVEGALQQHLGHIITVSAVEVDAIDAQLVVQVSYVVNTTGQSVTARFEAAP